VIGVLLIVGAAVLLVTNTKQVWEIYIYAGVLVLQSLPFFSAVALAVLERLPRRAPKAENQDGNRVVERPLAPVAAPVKHAARVAVAHPLARHADEQSPATASRTA
jgi:hypothetical protein